MYRYSTNNTGYLKRYARVSQIDADEEIKLGYQIKKSRKSLVKKLSGVANICNNIISPSINSMIKKTNPYEIRFSSTIERLLEIEDDAHALFYETEESHTGWTTHGQPEVVLYEKEYMQLLEDVLSSSKFYSARENIVKRLRCFRPDIADEVDYHLKRIKDNSEKIFAANYWLIIHASYEFKKIFYDQEVMEFIQESSIRALRAAQLYDPDKGVLFRKYLSYTIKTSIIGYMIKQASQGVFSNKFIRTKLQISKIRETQTAEPQEDNKYHILAIAKRLGHNEKFIQQCHDTDIGLVYLDEPLKESPGSTRHIELLEYETTPEDILIDKSLKDIINSVLTKLSPIQEEVLRKRFGIDSLKYTLKEIGDEKGLSRERIRQIEANALKKLRHPLILNMLKDLL